MANVGLFLEKHFTNKEVELYFGEEFEYINYSDTSRFNRAFLCGVFKSYDEETGILILEDKSKRMLFICEDAVKMFWLPGTKITESINTTIRTTKKDNKDIMGV